MSATNIEDFKLLENGNLPYFAKAINTPYCFSHTQNMWVWGSNKKVSLFLLLYIMTH